MSARSHRWLSRGAEQLEVLLQAQRGQEFDCDVLVVGSGYGGAVAAARLAGTVERGQGGRPARVWLAERGAEHVPGRFPSRFSELPGHVRFSTQDGQPSRGRDEGLFDFRLGPDVSVLLGNGLGGGSLINAGVMAEPEPGVLGGDPWPPEITHEALQPAFARVRQMLQPQTMPPERATRKLAVFDAMAAKMGRAKADRCEVTIHLQATSAQSAAGVELRSCTLCGDCLTGCNQGAKGSLDTNYLAHARRRGAELFCGVAVERIEPGTAGASWRVLWHYTDRQLRRTQVGAGVIRARRVVLAAGSLGSTEILLRSREAVGLPKGRIGQRFSTNGDAIMAGVGHAERVGIVGDPETDPADPLARRVGPTITGMVRVPGVETEGTSAPGFVVQEFAVPAALRQMLGEVTTSRALFDVPDSVVDPGLPLMADRHVVHDDAVMRTSLFGVMGQDGAEGTLHLPESGRAVEGGLRIRWDAGRPDAVYRGATDWLEQASGATVLASPAFLLGAAPMLTVHPLGGCAMAGRGDSGVVNACGQVFRGDGAEVHTTLVVLDGSVVPRSLGINPALTIAALAERALPELMACWELEPATGEPCLLAARPVGRRLELPPAEVTWGVRERLHGACEFDGRSYWARLEIEFDPVPGFGKALQLSHRVLKVRRAELFMVPVPAGTDEFTVDEEAFSAPGVASAQLTGTVELFVPNRWPADADESSGLQPASHLVYRLAVRGVGAQAPSACRLGSHLLGVKTVLPHPGATSRRSPWRDLSEMEMSLDGRAIGRWTLDLADLAQRRDPLLSLQALTTMPDALADLGAVALFGVRRLGSRLLAVGGSHAPTDLAQVAQRWPGPLQPGGPAPEVTCGPGWPAAWRLSRYRGAGLPVLLIHGLGASGANYTHAQIPHNLARWLQEAGRDVWVLDLRSSIANEAWRRLPESATASVEQVALADIPPAVAHVCEATGEAKIDVFAHCMGAVMFTLAALGDETLPPRIRSVVLSQAGPLVRLSPFNQLRGFVGSYLQAFMQVQELDATPDVVVDDHGVPVRAERGALSLLLDALLGTFPYADDDGDADIGERPPLKGTAFRDIRHRADAIFGQLFELKNMAPEALAHLAALFGWVKLPMLAQAIHFARQEMLTDARGRNAFLSRDRIVQRFGFPVLMVHGQRNRVFDWRGSLRSLKLLRQARGLGDDVPEPALELQGRRRHYAAGKRAQLVVLEGYGHLDCVLGRDAHEEVFPVIWRFFDEADVLRDAPPDDDIAAQRQPEPPWMGPMLGAVAEGPARAGRGRKKLVVSVLVHPSLRRRQTHGFVVVPVRRTANGPEPDLGRAAWKFWPGRDARLPERKPGERAPKGKDVREAAVRLVIDVDRLGELGDTFALLTLHKDLSLPQADAKTRRFSSNWLGGGFRLLGEVEREVGRWVRQAHRRGELQRTLFSLPEKVRRAAHTSQVLAQSPDLTFALASCQYPPGLLDLGPAQASLRRLAEDADASDGPQFLLLAGDQVYADATAGVFEPSAAALAGAAHREARFDRTYQLNWGMPAFRRLVSRLPVYPMLDDHEVRDNWQGLAEPGSGEPAKDGAEALRAFDRFQQVLIPRPAFMGAARGSKSYRMNPAGVPLFVMDTRSRRTWRAAAGIEKASIVAEAELDALIESLRLAPAAAVKLVMTPVPLLPPERVAGEPMPERLRSDTWSGFPESARRLLAALRDHEIGRVVLLAGDSHLSSVTSLDLADRPGLRVVSVVSSGLYAPWPFANTRPDELLLEGEWGLGSGPSGVRGTLRCHAISAADGYAIVHLQPSGTGDRILLRVSLRSGDGSTVECSVDLGRRGGDAEDPLRDTNPR